MSKDLDRMGSSDLFTLYEHGEITLEQLERWNDGLVKVSTDIQAKRHNAMRSASSMKRAKVMAASFAVISPLLGPGAVMAAAMACAAAFIGGAAATSSYKEE